MATPSPLAAALKPVAGADESAEARYQSALKQMTDALDQRKNRLFDPTLLAMSAGFLAPTQTGSFFESLGNAAKLIGPAEEKEMREAQELAAMRLQMAQAEREMSMKRRGLEFFENKPTEATSAAAPGANILGAAPARGATTAPGAATAPAAGAISQVTQGNSYGPGVVINGREVTPDMIARLQLTNPDVAKAYESVYKMTMDSISVQPGGYVNKITREYIPFPGKPPVERFIAGDPATNTPAMRLMLPEEDAMALDRARRTNDTKTFYEIIDRYTKVPARPSATPAATTAAAPGATPGAAPAATAALPGAVPVVRPSLSSAARTPSEATAALEVETEAAKAEAKINAEGRARRFENILTSAEDTGSRLALYKSIDSIVAKPNSEKIFGIFNRPDFMAGVGKLIETGIGVPGFSIGIPEIQSVMRNIKLPQEQINDYQLAASLFAQMQLQFSRLQQGQGAVSDFERRLYGSASVTAEDNPGTIRKKIAMLTARAEFERSVAKNLRASKLSADDFKDSDQYRNLVDSYHDRLRDIVSAPSVRPAGARPAAGASAAGASAPETAESLKARVNKRTNP